VPPEVATDGERATALRTILLATDLGPASSAATTRAIDLARDMRARLVCVNVVEQRRLAGLGRHDRHDQALAERVAALVPLVQQARAFGVDASYLTWSGDPASGILAAAEAEEADLIVVGTHGRDLAGRLLLGSVSDRLVHDAPVSVLVVRDGRA
jgi:nucleotide-binding universal stress UspA family protein